MRAGRCEQEALLELASVATMPEHIISASIIGSSLVHR
jgi:hypothetical protein